ncbi:hypothetical protein Lal_00005002 [Lupinus albus]|uniref:Putative BURP domain-containing protein n=1 Tax=Lupinus albus TaxID=3870 RepID=A0A6A4NH78_LUPAL|nr:putative BURP domain-containing protein [Lupinus albus]KAF1865626.1 hypothetical protein Lal_00005002 [Lupinus albus]
MRLGVSSLSFFLCTILVFVIIQDSCARKIQLKEGSYDLQHLTTKGHVLDHILQVEGGDHVEISKKPIPKDDDDDGDHDHKKFKGNDVEEDDHDDDEDEDDHKKIKGKYVKKYDEHKKIKGKDVHANKPKISMDHNHMDPELNVFFTPADLTVGKTMPIYFAKRDSSTSPKFLPREEADKIPFSTRNLPSLLKFFSFSKHSVQAKAMKYTLKQCEFEPMEGETKFCATSLESLLDFASDMFGPNSQFKVLTTTHLTNSTTPLQNYTIKEIREISVPNIIGCHPMPYPYAVFYCHSQKSDTSMYEVLVEGQNGGLVQAAAICHMDTSKWDPDHVSFQVLNVGPGTSPVCHFFPPDNLAWVPLHQAP